MKKHSPVFKPEYWTPLLKQLEIVNRQRHSGTIKSAAVMIHTLVKQYIYTIYIYNASKQIFECIGDYRFIGDDSLNYKFEEVNSKLSNIDFHEITLPKMVDDRYFFQANNSIQGD